MPLRRALLLLPFAVAGGWLAWRWRELPPEIASSFDFAGNARDLTSRGTFAVLMLSVLAGVALLFGGLATWMPHASARWINLPDKDYWLAPERRSTTLARVALFLDVVGVAMGVFLGVLFIAVLEHARAGGGLLAPWWIAALVVYVVFTIVALVWLNAPFRARSRSLRAAIR